MHRFDRLSGLAVMFTSVNMLTVLYHFHGQMLAGLKPFVADATTVQIVLTCVVSLWGGLRLLLRSAR